ncbi:type II secretory pathway, component PulJ [Terrimicrobium sacchariphilum]|uniref:Type II secretory pathway, component PulJ n=1 Tax=Terrimicrobium sacchariphilum TaxID=690879 RepID=A0A146GDA5_TERSA|nr:type II secretion system protein [Terrimicrobium sacchariphilum]GAT35331.1 type II secretory pathway, component PulJ [Terrimicrobium sacchariphilum]
MDKPRSNGAFTLVELLAATAVFILLMGLLMQVLGSVSSTSDLSQRRLEVLRQAITALQRVEFDLRETIHTGGSGIFVNKGGSGNINDELYFFAPVSGSTSPAAPRKLSLVKYGVSSPATDQPSFGQWPEMPSLSRTVRPFGWGDDVGKLLPLSDTAASTAIAAGDTQQISPSIIRYEICFQQWNGTISSQPPSDWASVRALIIGVVAIDRKAASRLTQGERDSLASQFAKPGANDRPSAKWNGVIANLPQSVREGIRIYEQTISI